MNCQLENIIIYNIISCFKTLKVGKKKQLLFVLEKGAKKKNRGFKLKNIYHKKRKGENKNNTNPELLRS